MNMDKNMAPGKAIFIETIPIIGEVPMVFFIPENIIGGDDEKHKLRSVIEKYGGVLSEFHECFTY